MFSPPSWRKRFVRSLVHLSIACACGAGSALAAVPNPEVSGPIAAPVPAGDPSHDYPQLATQADLAGRGYVEQEFFFSGTANRYSTPSQQTGTVIQGGYPYRSRMLVRRPADPAKFNGVVIVEWVNVTPGYNFDLLWIATADYLMREGYAYVSVSAQRAGVHQAAVGLKDWGPARYASLDVTAGGTVTNDGLAYDIFAQAARAVQSPQGVDPLGGLPGPRLMIASGVSQSQGRLVTYYNSIQPLHTLFDSFYLHLGTGGRLRTDLPTKVFKINTENDVLGLGEGAARQADSAVLRTWEITGTSHVNHWENVTRFPLVVRDGLPLPDTTCNQPSLSRIQTNYVLNAAYQHLVAWTRDGVPPPTAERIQLQSNTVAVRDAYGNALGGIRLADLAVPTATNTGVNTGASFCSLYGSHVPFAPEVVSQLYPTHAAYTVPVNAVTDANLAAGYILAPEAALTRQAAADSLVGRRQGDVTGDDLVNCADLRAVNAALGRRSGQPGYVVAADIDGNGVIDVRDVAAVARVIKEASCR
jgi:hypothetical protein